MTLQYEEINPGAAGIDDVFALLEWGSAGFQASTIIDVLRGTILNVNCSWLRITAGLDGDDDASIKFGAFACYGNRPAVNPIQRTVILTGLGAPTTTSAPVAIPSFAQSVLFSDQASGVGGRVPADYDIEFLSNTGGIVAVRHFSTSLNSGYRSGIPTVWPNDAVSVRVRNTDSQQVILTPKLIFQLAL